MRCQAWKPFRRQALCLTEGTLFSDAASGLREVESCWKDPAHCSLQQEVACAEPQWAGLGPGVREGHGAHGGGLRFHAPREVCNGEEAASAHM